MPTEVADDDCITSTTILHSRTTSEPSRMSAFIWSGKIYAVMSKVLQSLYVPVDVRGFQDTERAENEVMLSIESELQSIRETLPPHLSMDGPISLSDYPDTSDWRLRQKVIIQNRCVAAWLLWWYLKAQVVHPLYRFLRTRALLFRPSLLRALKAKAVLANTVEPPAATLVSKTSISARQLCFECACEQIDLCYATTTTQLDAPWFRRFCRQIVAGAIRSGAH